MKRAPLSQTLEWKFEAGMGNAADHFSRFGFSDPASSLAFLRRIASHRTAGGRANVCRGRREGGRAEADEGRGGLAARMVYRTRLFAGSKVAALSDRGFVRAEGGSEERPAVGEPCSAGVCLIDWLIVPL